MSQVENHLMWCLKDERRLVKREPDPILARKHLEKSEYNYSVVQILENLKIYDWALNIAFYSIYHCFLALLSKYGYESRNQSCTITVLLSLIGQKKLNFNKELILLFDTLEGNMTSPTVRRERELSTYGIETSINIQQLNHVKELVLKVQRETVKALTAS